MGEGKREKPMRREVEDEKVQGGNFSGSGNNWINGYVKKTYSNCKKSR